MAKRFVVIGCGGVGQWSLELLSRIAEYEDPGSAIILVDGDRFEPKNMVRQHFMEFGNKAEVKAFELSQRYEATEFVPISMYVVDQAPEIPEEDREYIVPDKVSVREVIAEGDVVIVSVDNFAARKVVYDAAREFDNIDVFTGGNDDALFGSIYHYQRRDGVEVTEHPSKYHDELVTPPDRNPGEMSCQERAMHEGGTQLAVVNMGVASFMIARLHSVLYGSGEVANAEGVFDLGLVSAKSFDRAAEAETLTTSSTKTMESVSA